jgi:transcription initiation factor TFIIIB Brf1 subunit/transcription initiation factor TFIIB
MKKAKKTELAESLGELLRIRENLRIGDKQLIAEATGFSREYVKKVLSGKRHNEKIVAAAKQLLLKNERVRREMLNQLASVA